MKLTVISTSCALRDDRRMSGVDERYERLVDRSGGRQACHPWTGAVNGEGFAMFNGTGYRTAAAHRWAYLRYVGPLAAGEVIRFACEFRRCQNREHWTVESRSANARRTKAGERAGRAKLTAVDVVAIRTNGETAANLATRYGVTPGQIYRIRAGTSWHNVSEPLAQQ